MLRVAAVFDIVIETIDVIVYVKNNYGLEAVPSLFVAHALLS